MKKESIFSKALALLALVFNSSAPELREQAMQALKIMILKLGSFLGSIINKMLGEKKTSTVTRQSFYSKVDRVQPTPVGYFMAHVVLALACTAIWFLYKLYF